MRKLAGRKTFPVRIEQIGFGLVLLERLLGRGETRAHLLDPLIEPFADAAGHVGFRGKLLGEIGFREGIRDAGGLPCVLRPGIEFDDVSQTAALGIHVLVELVDDAGQRIVGCVLSEQEAYRKKQHGLRLRKEAAGAEFRIVQKVEFPRHTPHRRVGLQEFDLAFDRAIVGARTADDVGVLQDLGRPWIDEQCRGRHVFRRDAEDSGNGDDRADHRDAQDESGIAAQAAHDIEKRIRFPAGGRMARLHSRRRRTQIDVTIINIAL